VKIEIIAIGHKMPNWINTGIEEYKKRFPPQMKLSFKEIPLLKRNKQTDIARLIDKEAQQMKALIAPGSHVIALEVQGQSFTTELLAKKIQQFQALGKNITILIGGPEGLHPSCSQLANESWSLSKLTLPHPLVRVFLTEAIYRAWTITVNHPYHK